MSAITPSSHLKLLKVPIELDNANQLTFANATAQYNYFNGLPDSLSVDNFTYQRKDGIIRYPGKIDDLWPYNYVMYRNDGFSNKWIYAYIKKMEFVNPNTTDIYIETDVFQTWQFSLEYKQSFVEREHVSDDTIGKHTFPEGLDTGDYVIASHNGETSVNFLKENSSSYYVAIGLSNIRGTMHLVGSQTDFYPRHNINGVHQGLSYVLTNSTDRIGDIIKAYTALGAAGEIINMFIIPNYFFTYYGGLEQVTWNVGGETISDGLYVTPASSSASKIIADGSGININTKLDGTYVPKNNKLFTYPYNYLSISNNAGNSMTLRWELFANPSFAGISAMGCFAPGGSIRLFPVSYANNASTANSYDYGLTGAKFPSISWTTDTYLNWLTQNGVNVAVQGVTSTIGSAGLAGASIATGNVGMGVIAGTNAVSSIYSTIHQYELAEMMPNQAHGNINAGDVVYSDLKCCFTARRMSIKKEYAAIIDNYFSKFGYKVAVVKVPNITGRANWNYVKTIDCKIHAYIPQEDLQTLMRMFDNGVTFWHNPATFLDYSQNNGIL